MAEKPINGEISKRINLITDFLKDIEGTEIILKEEAVASLASSSLIEIEILDGILCIGFKDVGKKNCSISLSKFGGELEGSIQFHDKSSENQSSLFLSTRKLNSLEIDEHKSMHLVWGDQKDVEVFTVALGCIFGYSRMVDGHSLSIFQSSYTEKALHLND